MAITVWSKQKWKPRSPILKAFTKDKKVPSITEYLRHSLRPSCFRLGQVGSMIDPTCFYNICDRSWEKISSFTFRETNPYPRRLNPWRSSLVLLQLLEDERRQEASRRGKGKFRLTWEEVAITAAVTDEKVITTYQQQMYYILVRRVGRYVGSVIIGPHQWNLDPTYM